MPGLDQGSPHTISIYGSTVSVPPHGDREIHVRLSVQVATAGGPSLAGVTNFSDVAGILQLTPVSGSNNGVTLRVPYYMVPAAISNVQTRVDDSKINRTHTATAVTTNYRGAVLGNANWFAWGIKDKRNHGLGSNDLQAVGVQSFPAEHFLQFAISTNHRWSNAAQDIFNVYVDVNNDTHPDYIVEAADLGALQGQDFNGIDAVAVFALASNDGESTYLADAPTDSSTICCRSTSASCACPATRACPRRGTSPTGRRGSRSRTAHSIRATGRRRSIRTRPRSAPACSTWWRRTRRRRSR